LSGPLCNARPNTAFVSYSRDADEHADAVLEFAMRLEEDGVAVSFDQYEDPPDWALWMEQQVKEPQFVLMVCTEAYNRRVSGNEGPGRGAGATFEGALIRKLLVESNGRDARFIPILLTRKSDPAHIPIFLNGRYYRVYESDDYAFLLHRIQGAFAKGSGAESRQEATSA
jgi:hypothetical protein